MTLAALQRHAKSVGVGLVGVAPVDRFEGVAPERHPSTIFPEAKTVVVFGMEIPRGAFRGIEEGTLWTRAPRQMPPKATYELARFLEEEGWEAVPLAPLAPERWPDGVPVSPDRVAPNVSPSLDFAAVAAGLGEIGLCGVFLTPQYGPRQSLGMVITDAPIESTPQFGGMVCDRESCLQCSRACPLGAIDESNVREVRIAAWRGLVAEVNRKACLLCPNGAFADESSRQGVPNFLTASCVRACIAHLEEVDRLTKKYQSPFRKRDPWALGVYDV